MKKLNRIVTILTILLFWGSTCAQYINPGVVLTFDDYSVTNWHKLLPVFEKYNVKATFFVTKPYALNSVQQQMLIELYEAGNEIACHGFHHYNAVNFLDTSNLEQYLNQEILPAIHWFDSVLHIPVQSFAYPYGARNQELDNKLLKYFKIIRGTDYQIFSNGNKLTRLTHPGLVFGVGIDKNYGNNMNEIEQTLISCKTNNYIQIFYSHTPVDSVIKDYQISYTTLDSILAFAYNNHLSFYTISEARLPKPTIPQGDTLIVLPQSFSDYQTDSSALQYSWNLYPPEAGTMISTNNELTLFWNDNFSGSTELSVAHINTCGKGDYSNSLKITVQQPASVLDESEDFMVYPNPSQGTFTVYLPDHDHTKAIEIFDLQGRLLAMNKLIEKQNRFEIANQGIYFIRITTATKFITTALVVE